MNNSQHRIEQVSVTNTVAPTGDSGKDPNANTTTTTTTSNNPTTTDTTTDTKDTTTTTTTDQPTDDKLTNKPIIVLMDKPKDAKNGMVAPSEVVYFGVMGAIIIALLAVAYNSVKTANIAKVK